MEKYDEYKDSGVEWIGQVPAGWNVCRIGDRYDSSLGKMLTNLPSGPDDTLQPYLCAANIQEHGIQRDPVREMYFSPSDKQFELHQGDAVVVEGGNVGLTQIWSSERSIYIQNALHRVRSKDGSSVSYFKYWMDFVRSTGYLELVCNKATIRHYTKEKLTSTPMLDVSERERNAIANYLDEKTAQIDEVVAETEKSIDLLEEYRTSVISEAVTKGLDPNAPMKDSGVEWIGEIPEGWEVIKLCRLGSMQNGISKGSEYFGSGFPFVTYGNVYRNELSNTNLFGSVQSTSSERELYSVRRGDVLFTRTSETIDEVGISAVALNDIPDSCFAGFLIRFRPSDLSVLLPEFAAYYFRSDVYRPFLSKEMVLVTRASLGQQLLGNVSVLIPPLAEQRGIAAYLDERTAAIDALAAEKRTLLDQLREYRKSLISEAVTGKFKVPGVD